MLARLQALPERAKLAITFAVSAAAFAGLLAATPTPAAQCRDAGYDDAARILQPDGHSREWLCFSLPAADLSTPYRSAYLKEIR